MKRFLLSLLLSFTTLAHAQMAVVNVVPRGTPAYFTAPFLGVHSHTPSAAGKYPAAPFGSWRTWDGSGAGTWASIQPTSATGWSWATTDAYVDQVQLTPGTKILVTLGRVPAWASSDPTEASAYGPGMASAPASTAQFAAYAGAMAARYAGRVEAYELWNEFNNPGFWNGTTAQLVEIGCAAYHAIKLADPAAIVLSPSGMGAWPERTNVLMAYLQAGGAACADVIAYHLYTSGSPPENFVQPMLDLRAALVAAGYGNKPLWNTETGYLTPGTKTGYKTAWSAYNVANAVTDYDAGDFMVRAMLLARALDFQRFYWYAWDDYMTTTAFGFIDPGSKLPRDQAAVVKRFSNAFTGAGLVGSCNRSTAGVWQCYVKIAAGSFNAQVLWVDATAPAQSQSFTLPLRANVSNFHSDGVTLMPANSVVNLTSTPQLFVWQ